MSEVKAQNKFIRKDSNQILKGETLTKIRFANFFYVLSSQKSKKTGHVDIILYFIIGYFVIYIITYNIIY